MKKIVLGVSRLNLPRTCTMTRILTAHVSSSQLFTVDRINGATRLKMTPLRATGGHLHTHRQKGRVLDAGSAVLL